MSIEQKEERPTLLVGPTPPTAEELAALGRRAIGMAMTGCGGQAAAMMAAAYAAARMSHPNTAGDVSNAPSNANPLEEVAHE